ncbi:MAG: hypothetical protein R3F11_31935 [Verrucomicrobiales bacterium]
MRDLLGNLREGDAFNVLLFAASSEVLSKGGSLPATRQSVAKAMRMLDARGGGGGTELVPALKARARPARRGARARSVILITDGLVSAEREAFEIARQNWAKRTCSPSASARA